MNFICDSILDLPEKIAFLDHVSDFWVVSTAQNFSELFYVICLFFTSWTPKSELSGVYPLSNELKFWQKTMVNCK